MININSKFDKEAKINNFTTQASMNKQFENSKNNYINDVNKKK